MGTRRLVEIGRVTLERAAEMEAAWRACQEARHVWMITPMVIEIAATRA